LKKQISQKQISSKQIFDNNTQVLNNYNNIDKFKNAKQFVLKKFRIKIDFELRDNLVYYFDKNNIRLQLYIFRSIKKNIFKTIYNNNYYFNYYCCFT